MIFGAVSLDGAEGAILAHSLRAGAVRLRKGRRLSAQDVVALRESGMSEVIVARLEAGDIAEDEAAGQIAAALLSANLSTSAAFTGRANLFAEAIGVIEVDAAAIAAANRAHEAVSLATLPGFSRVDARQMVATVKIIPYAAPREAVAEAARLAQGALTLHPVTRKTAALILTVTPGMKESVVEKGAKAVRDRLSALGVAVTQEARIPHRSPDLARALCAAEGEMTLILTASATSDRADVGPSALLAAGGRLERFGMPVDPGNLLFLGEMGKRPVIGLPGCARAPKLNGADWVLERLACGVPVSSRDIAEMGVGGLLKEISARPQPRMGAAPASRPIVGVVLLAAGASSRMRGCDKLLQDIGGAPLLRRAALAVLASRADHAVVVLPPDLPAREAALDGLELSRCVNPAPGEGMASSIRIGLAALPPDCDAALICLADMPEIGPSHLDRLIAAFDPGEEREICRAADATGRPGNPCLFGRRFFEALARLEGDQGARGLIDDHPDFVEVISMEDGAPVVDLDTPEDWAAWRGS